MLQDLIERGLREHRAGRLQQAKTLYEQVLAGEPGHPDALNLLGVIALESGDARGALAFFESAVGSQPAHPGFHANLAQARLALGRHAEARAAFQRAAALDPGNPQFALGAASALAMQGDAPGAERELRAVVRRHPDYALAWFNLGHTLRDQSRPAEAAACYQRAIELEPGNAEAHMSLGGALHALGRFDEAERAYRQCLALEPGSEAGSCNLASLLIDVGRPSEAERICREALPHAPGSLELHRMLGSALANQCRFAAALQPFRAAAAIAPNDARALWGWGLALLETGATGEGLRGLRRALELQPDSPDFRYGMAGVHLALGEFEAGWKEYAWRTARQHFLSENPALEPADRLPEDLSGRKVLLLREQGLGDELFFLRFAAALGARGATVTYCANAKIASLLARVPVLDRVVAQGDALPDGDFTLLIGDLPRVLSEPPSPARRAPGDGSREPGFPAEPRGFAPETPPPLALAPLPERVERVRRQLAAFGPPPYVGITWRAGTAPERQRGAAWEWFKEIPREQLASALRAVNGTFLALQRHPRQGEIEELARHLGKPLHDLTTLNEDLEAMLAALAVIDDYVGVSNTNMHLRAGVGKTARVLATRPHEWRWMLSGGESPWFPGFRIYRQDPDGAWDGALARLAQDLAARFGAREE